MTTILSIRCFIVFDIEMIKSGIEYKMNSTLTVKRANGILRIQSLFVVNLINLCDFMEKNIERIIVIQKLSILFFMFEIDIIC